VTHADANMRALSRTDRLAPPVTTGQFKIQVRESVLESNDQQALANREYLNSRKVFAINMMGSPGSGKTSLIVEAVRALREDVPVYVIEGDQFGSLDSERIREAGVDVIQINTGNGCHLDAASVGKAIRQLPLTAKSLLIIENVGNLVCPAMFDLGEHKKVVVLSVTEGDDKPVKYAPMFHEASVCIINKTDLLGLVDFDVDKALSHLRKINNKLVVFPMSATTGQGIPEWVEAIKKWIVSL
jgi:hydrogenase nickel incorporation protein HypB